MANWDQVNGMTQANYGQFKEAVGGVQTQNSQAIQGIDKDKQDQQHQEQQLKQHQPMLSGPVRSTANQLNSDTPLNLGTHSITHPINNQFRRAPQ